MIQDPIVDEVRAIREGLAARFDFDIRKIIEDARKRQASSGARVVSFQRPSQTQLSAGGVGFISPDAKSLDAAPVPKAEL